MLLNAHQIEELLQTNNLGAKAQVGYDLTLHSIKKVKGGQVTTNGTQVYPYVPVQEQSGMYDLLPNTTYSITFDQGCKLSDTHTALIKPRSSVLRCGGIILSGVYDPGFEVEQMGAIMHVTAPLRLEKGARIAQIIILENYPADLYQGQWQKERDVK